MAHVWAPEGYFRLFISHLSPHHKYAESVADRLRLSGITGFVAHVDIEPSALWQVSIESALSTADGLVALLHPDFHQSRWCDQEVGIAIGAGKPVLSVRLGADPHGFIGKYQGIAGAGKTAVEVADKIAEVLVKHPPCRRSMACAIGAALQNCGWDGAKRLTTLAELMPDGSHVASELITKAIRENPDIETAFGNVMKRLEAVANKWLFDF